MCKRSDIQLTKKIKSYGYWKKWVWIKFFYEIKCNKLHILTDVKKNINNYLSADFNLFDTIYLNIYVSIPSIKHIKRYQMTTFLEWMEYQ